MPVPTNLMERVILLRLNMGPGPMLDLLGAMAFKTVAIAVRLDIFEVIGSGSLSAADVARRIEADEQSTELLLQALESIGYIKKQDDRYANTPMSAKWMVRSSPYYIASGFPHFEEGLIRRWGYLDEAIRQGKPPTLAWEWLDQHPNRWEHYNAAMMATARIAGEEIIAKAKLPSTARRLIDVGGGHGLYAINFCHRYPALSATILDWPQARQVAESTIAAEKVGDRVTFQEGDFWKVGLGSGYDVALMFNIVHSYQPEKNLELLRKVAGALNPGATLIIMDQMAVKASGPMAKATARLFGLEHFVAVNGQTYFPREVTDWLTKTGFTSTRWVSLKKSPGFALVVGTKAG